MSRARTLLVVPLCAGLASCAFLNKVQERTGIKVHDPREQLAGSRECQNILDREVPWEEERDVGGVLALSLAQRGGGLGVAPLPLDGGTADLPPRPDPSVADQQALALAQVGHTVASFSSRAELPWTFGVLDSRVVNAFSTPGGYIFVTRGLLEQMENESQLAGVLAHEVGHVTLRHALHVYRVSKHAQCLVDKANQNSFGTVDIKYDNGSRGKKTGRLLNAGALTDKLVKGLLDPFIDTIVAKGFGQSDELEADAVATDLLVMAGYDPREYRKFLAKLPNEKGLYPNHPPAAVRAKAVDDRLRAQWSDLAWDKNPAVPLAPELAVKAAPAGKN